MGKEEERYGKKVNWAKSPLAQKKKARKIKINLLMALEYLDGQI